MEIYEKKDTSVTLGYAKDQCHLKLQAIKEPLDRAEAYGRIAFACSDSNELKTIERKMNDNKQTLLTPFISLDTPGKATVQVVIIADPVCTNHMSITFQLIDLTPK